MSCCLCAGETASKHAKPCTHPGCWAGNTDTAGRRLRRRRWWTPSAGSSAGTCHGRCGAQAGKFPKRVGAADNCPEQRAQRQRRRKLDVRCGAQGARVGAALCCWAQLTMAPQRGRAAGTSTPSSRSPRWCAAAAALTCAACPRRWPTPRSWAPCTSRRCCVTCARCTTCKWQQHIVSMRVFAFFCGLQPPRSWCWRVSGCARAAKNPFKQRWLKRTFAPESLLVKGRCGLRCLACQELQGWVAPKQGLRGMPREDAAWPGDGRDGPRVGAQTRCVRAERQSCVQGCLQRALETTAPHTPISTLRTRR